MSYNEAIPVVDVAGSGSCNSFLGGDGLAAIIIIALLFGWGRNGYGGGGNDGGSNAGSGAAMAGYVLTSDFANLERKIDGVNNGLCDGFYGQAQLVNGVQQSMSNGFMSAELSRANQQAALMQQLYGMQRAADNCCCENRAAIAQVRYDMATQACDTRNTVQTSTRDVIDALNAGFRGIDQRLTMQELAAKDARIAEQDRQLFMAALTGSQAAQTDSLKTYVNNQFTYYNPRPVPSFSVPTPFQYAGCSNGNGCSGCGY
jgi:hypothetical protein